MEWLSQNWIWIVVAIGAVWLFSRMRPGGMMGGCGHDMAHEGPPQDTAKKEAGDKAAQTAPSSHRHRGGCC
jgi:hypothetical protein